MLTVPSSRMRIDIFTVRITIPTQFRPTTGCSLHPLLDVCERPLDAAACTGCLDVCERPRVKDCARTQFQKGSVLPPRCYLRRTQWWRSVYYDVIWRCYLWHLRLNNVWRKYEADMVVLSYSTLALAKLLVAQMRPGPVPVEFCRLPLMLVSPNSSQTIASQEF